MSIHGARRRHAAAIALSAALIPLGSTILAVAIPAMAAETGADPARLTRWLVTGYLAVSMAGIVPAGRLGDGLGAARALRLGQAACGAGLVIGALAPSAAWLLAARVITAAGGAIMVPAAMALLREVTPEARRARAFGAFASVMSLAAAIGPVLGGEIAARAGWRATFVAQAIPLALSALLARGLSAVADPAAAPQDVLPRTGMRPGGRELVAMPFLAGGLAVALQNCAMYATLFLVPQIFTGLRGMDEARTGRILLALTGAMIAGSLAGGPVSERLGARRAVALAAVASVSGLALLRDVASIHGASDALAGLVLLGFGVGLTNGPAQGAAMSSIAQDRAATAAGILGALRYAGGILGMALLVPVAEGASPEAVMSRSFSGLLLAAGLVLPLALLLPGSPGSIAWRRRQPEPQEPRSIASSSRLIARPPA